MFLPIPQDVLMHIAEDLSIEPGAGDCLRAFILVLTSKSMRGSIHPDLRNRLLRVMMYFFTGELSELYAASASCAVGPNEPALPSIARLLHVMECPFERACNQSAHSLASATASEGSEAVDASAQTQNASTPPQRSKAQRMGLLLSAQQSCVPLAVPLLSAIKEETGVDPVQCCNVDCKGSKRPGIKWCPHCLGMVWCLDCVDSPSCRVHCSKCSQRGPRCET
ncbi:hypothetical protein DUNSADRAFT_16169 [Dunaliella salina]|uniref:Uncharacterized protein n=1 Tax=Dunaliella salina TaxID=3046 RepID=A0ABQ7G499_DUNSA|nr:hypothetical protein DUNSADRAFT_16169 [Dunaliella salina]|eukprot:KAF5829384.1 hypothetical protein DUNSADRAFT_16169 [Dunaliella salina]